MMNEERNNVAPPAAIAATALCTRAECGATYLQTDKVALLTWTAFLIVTPHPPVPHASVGIQQGGGGCGSDRCGGRDSQGSTL